MWSIRKVFGIYFMVFGVLLIALAVYQLSVITPTNFSVRLIADGETFFVTLPEFKSIPHPYYLDWAVSLFQFYEKIPFIIIIFSGYRLFRLGSKAYPLRYFIRRRR